MSSDCPRQGCLDSKPSNLLGLAKAPLPGALRRRAVPGRASQRHTTPQALRANLPENLPKTRRRTGDSVFSSRTNVQGPQFYPATQNEHRAIVAHGIPLNRGQPRQTHTVVRAGVALGNQRGLRAWGVSESMLKGHSDPPRRTAIMRLKEICAETAAKFGASDRSGARRLPLVRGGTNRSARPCLRLTPAATIVIWRHWGLAGCGCCLPPVEFPY